MSPFPVYVMVNTMEETGLGSRLRRKRLALLAADKRYSLRRVAFAVGMQPSHLSRIERGDSVSLSEEKLVALARELGECPDEILALSGKVAGDVLAAIRRRPGFFAALIRSAEGGGQPQRPEPASGFVPGTPFDSASGAAFGPVPSPASGSGSEPAPGPAVGPVSGPVSGKDGDRALLKWRFNESQRLARIGSWDRDLTTGANYWSDEMFRLFGREPGEADPTWEFFLGHVHPQDRHILAAVRKAAMAGPGEVEYRFRFVRTDGAERVAQAWAVADFAPDKTPVRISGTLCDITDHHAAIREVRELARFPRENPNPVLRVNRQGVVEYANPAAQSQWGLARDDSLASAVLHAGLLTMVRSALEHGSRLEGELRYSPRYFHCMAVPCPERQCANIYGMDITRRVEVEKALRLAHDDLERRVAARTRELDEANRMLTGRLDEVQAMEKALRASEERYRAVVESQIEVICRFSPEGTVLFANEPYCRLFGKTLEELTSGTWRPFPLPEDLPGIDRELGALAPDHPVVVVENRVVDGAGRVRFMQFINRGFFDAKGRITEIQSVGRDITDRRAAELALAESEKKYRDLVANLEVGILTATGEGRVDMANRRALEILGVPQDEILGQSLARPPVALCREDASPLRPEETPLAGVFLNQEPRRDVTVGIRQDGWEAIRWLALSVFPEHDARGNLSRVVVTLTDISERRRLEAELMEGRERFRFLYRHFPQPTCVFRLVEGDFILAEANRAAVTAGRGRLEGLLGHRAGDILAGAPEVYLALWTAFEGRQAVRRRMNLLIPTDPTAPYDVSFVFVPPDMVLVHAVPVPTECAAAEPGPAG
ncbi:PAS domain S-box protein [Desulfolutivibrio sp.]|uniref:PAS domain S-box protein n=1 Tax=Desulfolutivibrio sp. TaxID=2773296 RepID=UPI002F96C2E0